MRSPRVVSGSETPPKNLSHYKELKPIEDPAEAARAQLEYRKRGGDWETTKGADRWT